MNEELFDEVFNRFVNKYGIPSTHIYSQYALKKLFALLQYEFEASEVKRAEEGMRKMGFSPVEIAIAKQEHNCRICPDQCDAFAKPVTADTINKRFEFMTEFPEGCHNKWDLNHVGEGIGDWEGIYQTEDEPLFFSNIKELIVAFKSWWRSRRQKTESNK